MKSKKKKPPLLSTKVYDICLRTSLQLLHLPLIADSDLEEPSECLTLVVSAESVSLPVPSAVLSRLSLRLLRRLSTNHIFEWSQRDVPPSHTGYKWFPLEHTDSSLLKDNGAWGLLDIDTAAELTWLITCRWWSMVSWGDVIGSFTCGCGVYYLCAIWWCLFCSVQSCSERAHFCSGDHMNTEHETRHALCV